MENKEIFCKHLLLFHTWVFNKQFIFCYLFCQSRKTVFQQVEILSDKQLYMSFLGTAISFTYYKVLEILAALLPGPKSLLPWFEKEVLLGEKCPGCLSRW